VIIFAAVGLYLQEMSIMTSKVWKISKNGFVKYMYSIGVHLSTLVTGCPVLDFSLQRYA
jgi:hypothetical protein